jgi:beta-lactamase superfamily II metal-dependent hydrolase
MMRNKNSKFSRSRVLFFISFLAVIGTSSFAHADVCPFDTYNPNWQNELLIYHFYVGQGSSTFVRTPSGMTVLIDAGLPGEGAAAILPTFKACNITSLDYGVLTHPHRDHFGGWKDLFDAKISIKTFYISSENDDSAASPTSEWSIFKSQLAAALQSDGSPAYLIPGLGTGAIQDTDGQVTFNIVAVNGKTAMTLVNILKAEDLLKDCNSASIAQVIHYKNFSYWEGGDLTSAGTGDKSGNPAVEESVAPSVGHVDVFHADHHGSDTSNSDTLLAKLTPTFGIGSVGIGGDNGDNTKLKPDGQANDAVGAFHLPNVDALNRMQAHGMKAIYMTSKGETQVTTSAGRFPVDILTDPSVHLRVVDNQMKDVMLTADGDQFSFFGVNIGGGDNGPFPATSGP